jgi:hypothetical protein
MLFIVYSYHGIQLTLTRNLTFIDHKCLWGKADFIDVELNDNNKGNLNWELLAQLYLT